MKKEVLLTISILISNRPDTVKKCLDSLEQLRKKIPSELILVDTGCGEKLRKLLEEYTDKIIDFEWCRDFSKARNAGLDKAQGEWFLYLDDDEWFEDTDEIENFFTTGLYRHYGLAMYKQRNYSNREGTVFSDLLVGRMVRLDKGVRFCYSIHECFQNSKGSTKTLNSYVHHYGYIYKSSKELYLHSKRNIEPLLKEHRLDIHNLRHNVQLAQEYTRIGEYSRSIDICKTGISDFKSNAASLVYINALFSNIVECYFKIYDYEEAYQYAQKYVKDKRTNILCRAQLNSLLCRIQFFREEYASSIDALDQYLEAYDMQAADEDVFTEYTAIFLYPFEDHIYNCNLAFGIKSAIKMGEVCLVQKYFDKLDLTKKPLMIESSMLEDLMDAYIEEDDCTKLSQYRIILNSLMEYEALYGVIFHHLVTKIDEDKDLFSNSVDKWNGFDEKKWIFTYLRLFTDKGCMTKDETEKEYCSIWNQTLSVMSQNEKIDIWKMGFEYELNVAKVISSIPFYKWKQAITTVVLIMKWETLQKINENMIEADVSGRYLAIWNICYLERLFKEMEQQKDAPEYEEIEQFFYKYIENTREYGNGLYDSQLMLDITDVLPECFQVSDLLYKFLKYKNEKKYKESVEKLKEIREVNDSFAIPVKVSLQYVKELMIEEKAEQDEMQKEMQDMLGMLKTRIADMMAQGQYEAALQVILQLKEMVPNDEDIIKFESLCIESREG